MSLTDYADDFFTAESITYSDAETNICKFLPSVLFKHNIDVQYRQIAISDNSTYNYFMYQFGDNEFVQNLYNVRLGRLYEPETMTYDTPTTSYSLVTNYNNAGDILNVGIHGDGIIFDTEDAARNVILECSVINKTSTYLDAEIKSAIKFMYYYLYTEDKDGYYNYMRRLNVLKKNRMKENVKTRKSRKVYYATYDPLVM